MPFPGCPLSHGVKWNWFPGHTEKHWPGGPGPSSPFAFPTPRSTSCFRRDSSCPVHTVCFPVLNLSGFHLFIYSLVDSRIPAMVHYFIKKCCKDPNDFLQLIVQWRKGGEKNDPSYYRAFPCFQSAYTWKLPFGLPQSSERPTGWESLCASHSQRHWRPGGAAVHPRSPACLRVPGVFSTHHYWAGLSSLYYHLLAIQIVSFFFLFKAQTQSSLGNFPWKFQWKSLILLISLLTFWKITCLFKHQSPWG